MKKQAEFNAPLTELTLRTLFDAIPEAMFLMDCRGILLEANSHFSARFGKRLAECIGKSVYDLLPPEVAAHRQKKVAEVLSTGKKISFEGNLEGDSLLQGRKIHHICPLFGLDGKVNRLVVFSQDITELKRTEESLMAARAELDEDLQAMSKLHEISGLFVREGNVAVVFEKVIDAACTFTGAGMGSIRLVDPKTGHLKIAAQHGFVTPLRECCHDSTVGPCLCDNVQQIKEQVTVGDIATSPLIWGKKEREMHLAEGVTALQLTPLANRSGELLGILTTYFRTTRHFEGRVLNLLNLLAIQTTDIIERAEKEVALQQSEELQRLALESSKSGSWMWDFQTKKNIWSDELWTLYGLEPNDCEPTFEVWRKTMHPDDQERVEEEIKKTACNGDDLNVEWRVLHDDGCEHWLMSRGRAICNAEGRPLKMIGIVIDITERKRAEEQLFESNERYSSLFSNTLNGIAYCRMIFREERPVDFVYEHVNARFESLTGLKNVEGRSVSEVIPGIGNISPELLEIFGRVAKTGIAERFEFYLEPLKIWLDISVYSRQYGHFVSVFNVITERKQTENALRESEKKFRSITEQMAEVVFVINNFGHITYTSSAIEKIFGYTSQEIHGHLFTEYLFEDDVSRTLAIFNDSVSNHVIFQVLELRCRKKNGSVFYGEVHLHYYYENDSFGLIGLIHDITERKRNEAVMEFRLRLLMLPDSCSIEEVLHITLEEAEKLTESSIGFFHFLEADQMNISLQVWSANTEKRMCQVKSLHGHYPLKDAGVWADAIRERRAVIHNSYETLPNRKGMPQGHAEVTREVVVPVIYGEKITAIIGIGNKHEDYDQEDAKLLSAMAGIAWDIIARKQAELSESKIRNELVDAQKMELVGRLAGGIAHDFNNMLCVILGHAEMALLDNPLNESLTVSLQEIFNAAEKSTALTRQLLAFARKQPLIPKVLDLNVVIEGTLNLIRRLIGEEITLDWHPGKNLSSVYMDSSHIDQILVNLCVNARDAITGTGKIVVETKNVTLHDRDSVDEADISSGECVMLSVSDTGCGIKKKDAEHIFEPFFTTKESGKGTGLGLSMVYGIVKQNNGLINFSSEPGKGSCFKVYFPGYEGHALSGMSENPAGIVQPGEETILIVDDENEILKLSKMILQKQGYRVLTAGLPLQAIQIAKEHKGEIHLLLTDIIMPEMNGRNLSKKIRSIYPDIKILFMSGYIADINASQDGGDEVVNLVPKPFSVKELVKGVFDILHVSPSPLA